MARPRSQKAKFRRINLELSPNTNASLEWLIARFEAASAAEAIRHTIGSMRQLIPETWEDGVLRVQRPDGTIKCILFAAIPAPDP